MQLPSLDRIPNLRPVAVESASLATGRVVPVAPVNVPAQSAGPVEPVPSVVNLINQANKPNDGEGVYTSVSDPTRRGADAVSPDKDWTIKRPVPEKVEVPPPEPLSKVLMDHIKSLWLASASAVQVQTQVKNQLDTTQNGVNATQGALSAEVFTYSPTKINKTEKPQT
ncbi:MAG: hypothetical protein PHQ58_10515 [Rhodoferax sp.]|uniref:hypothetical protein n=1 Tax=Rhodoferax sp. TaxID=50421 RepID=UPI00260A73E6|nr:hypothetical protein [Rhodoferax sp.]MDD2880863.1 hypothetical protein [Rhodoferax sp.]